jgi:hypothetical protein
MTDFSCCGPQWDVQATIYRINESLKRRKYITWIDTESMKGSIMDAYATCLYINMLHLVPSVRNYEPG